jgi:hypothetical protein
MITNYFSKHKDKYPRRTKILRKFADSNWKTQDTTEQEEAMTEWLQEAMTMSVQKPPRTLVWHCWCTIIMLITGYRHECAGVWKVPSHVLTTWQKFYLQEICKLRAWTQAEVGTRRTVLVEIQYHDLPFPEL